VYVAKHLDWGALMDWTMIQESEAVTLVISLGGVVFLIANRHQIRRLPFVMFLVTGYLLSVAAAFATVAEGFFWLSLFNGIEHVFYLLSSVCIFVWLWSIARGESTRP
jgi:hypothetical protein